MITIHELELENVKRIKAVKLSPLPSGLTIIGGRNNQGKTSVLDAIAWALGGERYRPSAAQYDQSVIPPKLHLELSNGMIVERKGKNSALTVTDPSGKKGGQQILNEFISTFALDLPKFLNANDQEKAQTLLGIIGIGDELLQLEKKETDCYNHRRVIGQMADQKQKFAEELPYDPDAPSDLISVSALIQRQQEILLKNGENERKRTRLKEIIYAKHCAADELKRLDEQIESLSAQRAQVFSEYNQAAKDEEIAQKEVHELRDESTARLEEEIRQVEALNNRVRTNLNREKALEDAKMLRDQYHDLSDNLASIRRQKLDLLGSAKLPLPGLGVDHGALTYQGKRWDSMSGSDQLRVATAIVRCLSPSCGFVLLDKLEQMDLQTLAEFGEWLEQEGLQAIATRVSTGDECQIIIEDGKNQDAQDVPSTTGWNGRGNGKGGF